MQQPRKYVQAIINATASGQAVAESGWHVVPVKFCDVDRKGLVEYVRSDQLGSDFPDRAYRLALELNDLPSSDREPIFKLVIRHSRHVAAISREYHSGEVDIYDRQFVLNYLPCGTVVRPTGSACKACYCTTKRMEKMWQDTDMKRKANRQTFMDIEGRTHVFSRRAFFGNILTVVLALSAITYYFTGEIGTPKDDVEVLVTAFAAGSAFYVIYNHLFGSGESVRDAVRSRRPVGGISEHVPAAQRVAFLKWATYFADIGRILSPQDSCALTATARGAYTMDINTDADFVESMGMLFCKDAIIFPDSEGLVVNQVSRLSGLRYHTDWHESTGLLLTEVVSRGATLGQRRHKPERD
ncbi:unnamed protein product [Chondrus crispus]|nr:unnamed protein product [Chondrus crispus]CDF35325.1 unnamed protein product [Chondrus crispus]|eukprot:XP_005715144.1 unnamed protein product [Chondrus crispus]